MNKDKILTKIMSFAALVLLMNTGYSQDYFIQANGNDLGKGSIDDPFQTIEKALDKASESKSRNETVTIYLRQGTYRIHSTLALKEDLSNIHIQSYQGEEVIFSGGTFIPGSDIQNISFPKTKFHPKRKVYMVDLKKSGIYDYGKIRNVGFARPYGASWGEIFVNKKEMHLSRWPNKIMIPMGKVLNPGSVPRDGDFSNIGGVMEYDSLRIDDWANENEVWISGYFKWGYADDMVKIENIDTKKKTFSSSSPTLYGFSDSQPWINWYGVNILAELDDDGEYYIDRNEGVLYFISDEKEIETLEFSLLETPFFTIEGSENISISGIIFETSRGHGIIMSNSKNVTVKACEFRNLGGLGIAIGKGIEPFKEYRHEGTGVVKANIIGSLHRHLYTNSTFNREGGTNNRIVGCKFYQLGAGGVSIGGGNRETLEMGNNSVDNCLFRDLNRVEKSYRPAIVLTGVGNRVTHCEIYDAPSMAMLMGGNNHLIEYNYIHDVCLEVEDQGALYYGRDPSERGTIIRYNYFENIPDDFSTSAVYSDDGACGITVENNIFYKAGKMNILLGGGSDNVYRNNIFIDSKIGIHVDNRLQNWSKAMLEDNGMFETRLDAVNYKNPPYSVQYPRISSYFDNPSLPTNNIVESNVFLNVKKLVRGDMDWIDYNTDNYETIEDIGFADFELRNFSLAKKSKVFTEIPGFKDIPFHKIGLYETNDFAYIRKRNGFLESVDNSNKHLWVEKQKLIEAYSVTDPEIHLVFEKIKNNDIEIPFPNESEEAQWFGEGNFGLFMHWGPHSLGGSQPSWAMIKNYPYGYEERYSNPADYFDLATDFNPESWEIDKICKTAKEAGITYVVLTAKHHDGFGLWPSKYGNYNIGVNNPGMDLLKPYVEACRKYGLKVGFYFSQRDWHFPEYPVYDQNFNHYTREKYPIYDKEIDNERYKRWYTFTIAQLNELLTNYGKIDLIWFDGYFWPNREDQSYSDGMINWLRSKQEGIVVNDRWFKTRNPDTKQETVGRGDFATVEWKDPEEGIDSWWEFNTSWTESWGYTELRFNDVEALNKLILARRLGGNFLLNFGPSSDGIPPREFYPYMNNLAKWITPNREALFGADMLKVDQSLSNVQMTGRDNILYLHILPEMEDDKIILDKNIDVIEMRLLYSNEKLVYNKKKRAYTISRKKNKLSENDYHVIKVIVE